MVVSLYITYSVDCYLGRPTIIFREVMASRKAFCVCMSTHTIRYATHKAVETTFTHVDSTVSYTSTTQRGTCVVLPSDSFLANTKKEIGMVKDRKGVQCNVTMTLLYMISPCSNTEA